MRPEYVKGSGCEHPPPLSTLAGLLVFVFGAPAVIVRSLQGTLADSVSALFIAGANVAGWLVRRFGVEPAILGRYRLVCGGCH